MGSVHAQDISSNEQPLPSELAVAVIGMSGRFPGANTIAEFWSDLAAGVESISHFEEDELRRRGVPEELLSNDNYVKAGAFIRDIEMFDPGFFDMTRREAEITDPQHRILLECAHEALENAAYVAGDYAGTIGVYAGVGMNTYLLTNLMPNRQLLENMGMHQILLGNDKCYATSRIAYKLNLRGPCMSIDTACSSGLVSILMAYKSLISYDCDMALAGGSKVNSADLGYLYEPGGINSPDGHCRAFDAAASGTIFGSGAGVVVLKRLEDAFEDKDHIFAIIRGGAINNDGSDKVGFTAPSVRRQCDVIKQSLGFSEVPPGSISYVEAHGTGTRLGDPVELAALKEAFAAAEREGPCYIGSVKTNIGHLESAAGVAGLIKVIGALADEMIPPSLNYSSLNPAIDFAGSSFEVATKAIPWPRSERPRRACISSFGLGGTNAHLIVEEAPLRTAQRDRRRELLTLSAKTPQALEDSKRALQNAIGDESLGSLKDAAFTLAVGRRPFVHRCFAVADPSAGLLTFSDNCHAKHGLEKVAWIIPGQGSQHLGMCRDFHAYFDVFAQELEACCALYDESHDLDLKPLLLSARDDCDLASLLNDTRYAQPAIFIHAYAMAKQLLAWGVQYDLLLGHSLGEYVAACLSGAIGIDDALALVAARARLIGSLPAGAMLAVSATPETVIRMIEAQSWTSLDIAAINGPNAVVISGPSEDIDDAADYFVAKQLGTGRLVTSRAFHSQLLDPILDDFREHVARISFKSVDVPYVSSLTGKIATSEEIADPDYWVRHLRETVQFGKAVQTLQAQNIDCVVDLGPSTVASSLLRGALDSAVDIPILHCSPNAKQTLPADQALLTALGRFWGVGGRVDWPAVYATRDCYRIPLPGYQFQKQRCWVDAGTLSAVSESFDTVDRSAVTADAPASCNPDAPRNDVERVLGDIWQELLGVDQIRISDNFFELGGQSLLATRVMTRIYEKFGIELDVGAIFNSPTIEGLSIALLEEQMAAVSEEEREVLLTELEHESAKASSGRGTSSVQQLARPIGDA